MKKIGILFTSRNNYESLQYWIDNVDTEGFQILNIDEDSDEENKKIGKEVCEKNNIIYMDREDRGMQNNITTASKHFTSKNIDWIIWFQHDCFPSTKNFFSKLNDLLLKGTLNEFGVVGFNVLHDGINHLLSRKPLQKGNKLDAPWPIYDHYFNNQEIPYQYSKPFAIESAMWTMVAVKISQYEKYITPTDDYHFFHAWDDIAFQFLYNNVYNICIPHLEANHIQEVKKQFNIPVKSPHANTPKEKEKRNYYFSKFDHLKVWQDRWGWDWDFAKDTFESVEKNYKDTLLYKIYHHDPKKGPIKTFKV